jgi:hypothetical protein
MTLLDKIKLALRITVNNYDTDLTALIDAAQLDLGIAGVVIPSALDAIVERAIISYCKLHFSALSDGEWSRLKASYDEQKAQLATATGYTDWLGVG